MSSENPARTPINPNKCKKLGLRRTIVKTNCNPSPLSNLSSTPLTRRRLVESLTPDCATVSHASSFQTPVQTASNSRISASTGQYKLSLSRRVKDRFRKKRLDFVNASPIADTDSNRKITPDSQTREKDDSKHEVNCKTENSPDSNVPRSEHEAKVKELKEAIGVWKEAFRQSVGDLSERLNAEAVDVLERLHIPVEMLAYLDR